jgi:glycosyltransferase involved in cell wall biosynthesis
VRVALDAQLALGTATGIGEYVTGLAQALRRRGADISLLQCPRLDPWRFDRRVLWDQVLLPIAAHRARPDVLHCASGTMPALAPRATVVTVHDMAWLRVQQHAPAYARAYFGAFQLTRYRRAARIVVDSSFSRDEFLRLAAVDPARVEVVYPGVARDICALVRCPQSEPLALVVGTIERRKNLEVVVRALQSFPRMQVVACGPFTPYRDEVERLARACGVIERLHMPGYVGRSELLALYSRATLVAMPSRYEGFGYGAAQAQCAGVPLLAASGSSLPEIVAGAAPLLAPDDVTAWVEALRALLADPGAAEARAAAARPAAIARFAWARAAAAMETIYRATLDERQEQQRSS